jgi:hypothetical protein
MRRTFLIAACLVFALAGCGSARGVAVGRAAPRCTSERARRMVERRLQHSGLASTAWTLIGGSQQDGWLFRHRLGFYNYVGPGCGPWFPVTVGALDQGVRSARYVGHQFLLVGTRDSESSGAPPVPPYTIRLDPATGLIFIAYRKLPVTFPADIVDPTWPGQPPVHVRGIAVRKVALGFDVVFQTDLAHRSSFVLFGSGPNPDTTGVYEIEVMDATWPRRLVAPKGLPITLEKGLPPYATSVDSPEWWGSGATQALARAHLTAEEDTYTIKIRGVTGTWTLSTYELDGQVLLEFRRS